MTRFPVTARYLWAAYDAYFLFDEDSAYAYGYNTKDKKARKDWLDFLHMYMSGGEL